MIVSGYALDIYCDVAKCRPKWKPANGGSPDAEFTGETYSYCARLAKKAGWRLSRDRQKAVCPACCKTEKKVRP